MGIPPVQSDLLLLVANYYCVPILLNHLVSLFFSYFTLELRLLNIISANVLFYFFFRLNMD